jgi:hypothetical protein
MGGMEARINGPYWPEISDYAARIGARRRLSHGLRRRLQSLAASRLTRLLGIHCLSCYGSVLPTPLAAISSDLFVNVDDLLGRHGP